MGVDYDLVIIGSSEAGIYAAKNAVTLQARVALVTQCDTYLPNDTLINGSIGEVGRLNYRLANHPLAIDLPSFSFKQATDWAREVSLVMQANNSLANLAALGVDVITGSGEFRRLPQLAFNVANRSLRSRNFLLATGSNYVPYLDNPQVCLTPRQLWQKEIGDLPPQIIVVGSDPTTLELVQTLARFGKQVTLVVQQPRILPQEDPDIAMLIQAQLEAEGIKIYTNCQIDRVKTINEQKCLQVGDRTSCSITLSEGVSFRTTGETPATVLEAMAHGGDPQDRLASLFRALSADEIVLADCRQPNTAGLNLAGVNVKCDRHKILVNQKLQTTNPKIYACGDLIGGYALPNIARYEVNLILKNTLFFPWYKTNYHAVPWAIQTQPSLARVGLTQHQAQQQYGDDLYIIKQHFHDVAQAQISSSTSGVCKLIVSKNGEILGCSLIGDRAGELITTVALMIRHKIKLDGNPMRGLTSPSIPAVYPSMTEILEHSSQNFYHQKLQRNPKLLKRLRSWFAIRKSWSD